MVDRYPRARQLRIPVAAYCFLSFDTGLGVDDLIWLSLVPDEGHELVAISTLAHRAVWARSKSHPRDASLAPFSDDTLDRAALSARRCNFSTFSSSSFGKR